MSFITVRCSGCNNEQRIFERASTEVTCLVCENVLAEPTGGKAALTGERVE